MLSFDHQVCLFFYLNHSVTAQQSNLPFFSISLPEPTCLRQDTQFWNNQFSDSKILGVPVSRRMRVLVYMASRDKVDVDVFHKGIQSTSTLSLDAMLSTKGPVYNYE